jgi:hypothetical protein
MKREKRETNRIPGDDIDLSSPLQQQGDGLQIAIETCTMERSISFLVK